MKRIIFWIGITALIAGLILFFLAGATGPANQPWVPSVYQTNQAYWLALSLVGFVLIALGLFMKFKSPKPKVVRSNQAVKLKEAVKSKKKR